MSLSSQLSNHFAAWPCGRDMVQVHATSLVSSMLNHLMAHVVKTPHCFTSAKLVQSYTVQLQSLYNGFVDEPNISTRLKRSASTRRPSSSPQYTPSSLWGQGVHDSAPRALLSIHLLSSTSTRPLRFCASRHINIEPSRLHKVTGQHDCVGSRQCQVAPSGTGIARLVVLSWESRPLRLPRP